MWQQSANTYMTTLSLDNDTAYKQKVATRFSRAAHTYDQYARFQAQVVAALAPMVSPTSQQCWLDLGAGTGKGSALLQQHQSPHIVALDLSQSMLEKVREHAGVEALVCADAEQLPFQNAVFDGIFSSLAIQWCQRPERLFSELHRVLKTDGCVVLSTLLRGSMPELGEAWRQVDGRPHHNQYDTLDALLLHMTTAGFEIEVARHSTMTTWYASVKEAIYSLKKVGASLLTGESTALSPATWKAFEAQYAALGQAQGIPLSYEVALIKLKKVHNG